MIGIHSIPAIQDSENTRKGRILIKILWGSALIVTAAEAVTAVVLPAYILRWMTITVLFDLICVGLLLLNRRGQTRMASILFIALGIAIIFGIGWTGGGVKSPVMQFIPVPVVIAGLLLGWQAGVLTAIVVAFTGLSFVMAEFSGALPVSSVPNNLLNIWIASFTCVGILALLQYLSVASLNKALHTAEQELRLRVQAEDNLRGSEEKYRMLFENMTFGFTLYEVLLDEAGKVDDIRILDINDKAAQLYSRNADIKNKTIRELTSAFNLESHTNTIRVALTGEPVTFERYNPATDTYARVSMYSPQKHRTASIREDITAQKKAEIARAESEEKIRELHAFTENLLQSANIMIVGMDQAGLLTSFNRMAETITGHTFEEVEGKRWFDIIKPTDEHPFAWEDFLKATEGGTGIEFENPILTKSGEEKFIAWNIAEVTSKGERIGFISFGIDITARKLMEEELRASREGFMTIFKSSPDALILTRFDDNCIVNMNDTFTSLWGYTAPEVLGKTADELRLWIDPQTRQEYLKEIRDKGYCTNMQAEFYARDGGTMSGIISGKTVVLNGVVHIISVTRDITALKRAQEVAKSHEVQLIQAEKMASIGLLVSGVAHEINNPNNYLLLNAKILERAWGDAAPVLDDHFKDMPEREFAGLPYGEARTLMPDIIQGMIDGTDRIKKIVDSLRTYSRADTSDLKQDADLNKAVGSSMVLVANMLKKSTDTLNVKLDPALPTVKGSQQQLEQVIINLLTNACQALTARSQSIEIRTFTEGSWVCCAIRDEGVGIDPAYLNEIVTPFYTTKRESGGTGLGLSVSNNIIRNHGGVIAFDSHVHLGTEATLRLPIPTRQA